LAAIKAVGAFASAAVFFIRGNGVVRNDGGVGRIRGGCDDEVGAGIIVGVIGDWGGRDGLGQAAGGVKGGGFEFNPVFAWDWRGYGWNFTTRAAAIA
jgi:hypothetical protein